MGAAGIGGEVGAGEGEGGGGAGGGGVAADQRPQRSCSRAHCSSKADCRTTFPPTRQEITMDARIYKQKLLPISLKNLQWNFL